MLVSSRENKTEGCKRDTRRLGSGRGGKERTQKERRQVRKGNNEEGKKIAGM